MTNNTFIYILLLLLLVGHFVPQSEAWSSSEDSIRKIPLFERRIEQVCRDHDPLPLSGRRRFLSTLGFATALGLLITPSPSVAVPRAVGGAEQACREAGDCLQRLELDGAIGWTWGGKDRCDASDPRCGPDGQLRDSPAAAAPVPNIRNAEITHVVQIDMVIGRNETGKLRLGLFGNDCPQSVQQLVSFLSTTGLTTASKAVLENSIGAASLPVSLRRGGIVNLIVPFQRIELGVPSQAAAYAKSVGRVRAGDNFIPQPRPRERLVSRGEPFLQPHNAAGLVSIPGDGIGYGNGLGTPDDEIFANAFQITAAPVPSMDQEKRRVVGQLLDDDSMAFLARIASLPAKKGLKGIIPGQNAGPPLLRVVVTNVKVESLAPA